MQSAECQISPLPVASSSSDPPSPSPPPSPTHATERPRTRRKRHLASSMLALLCGSTAGAMDTLMSPIEHSRRSGPPSPSSSKAFVDLDDQNEKDAHATGSDFECTSSTPKQKQKPARLPSRRPSVRQRIQSLSRMSDRALSTAAGSILRRGSGSISQSQSQSPCSNSSNVPPIPSHRRGASLSSFASGKSSGTSSTSKRVIGSPSAFKHQFHLGPDAQPSGAWDESRWRQIVEMRTPELSEEPDNIIDVSSNPERASTSSDSERCGTLSDLSRSFSSSSRSHTHGRSASASHSPPPPRNEDDAFAAFAARMASATASSPNLLGMGGVGEDGGSAKTPKHLKRSSLVKRKPVPPLYPYPDDVPVPSMPSSSPTLSGSPSTAPASRTEFQLIPDPPAEPSLRPLSPVTPVAPLSLDLDFRSIADERDRGQRSTSPNSETQTQTPAVPAERIDVLVLSRPTSPAPTIPPRRHTLAHSASLRSRPASNSHHASAAASRKTKAQTPTIDTSVAVVAPVGEDTPTEAQPTTFAKSETVNERDEDEDTKAEKMTKEAALGHDASPKPSFSSLLTSASASESESSPEPRTPTDDGRRVSAGSAVLVIGAKAVAASDGDEDASGDARKRTPPAVRSPVDEETVYMTADEE